MHRRHLHRLLSFLLALTLLASSVLSAAAQTPQPPASNRPTAPSPQSTLPAEPEDLRPWMQRRSASAPDALTTPAVPVGQPGLSFRHVQTFGQTETPYLADAQHLNDPTSLFIDGNNSLYVLEEAGQRVLKYNASGANTLIVGEAGQPWQHDQFLAWPKGVTTDAAGNIWVTTAHAVKAFDPAGNLILRYPDNESWNAGSGNDRFNHPRGIAFDSTGRLFVADDNNHRVQVFTVSGNSLAHQATIGVTGVPGSDNSHFNHPAEIVLDSSNRLYVADVENFRVQRCTFSGAWTCSTFHGTGTAGGGANELSWAYGLGRDASGSIIFIGDGSNGRVKRCTTGGACTVFAAGFGWPADIAADSAGNVFISDTADFTVSKYTSSGGLIGVFAGVSGVPYLTDGQHLNGPWGVGVGADGSVYVSENYGYRLLKLDASGAAQWTVGEAGVYGGDNAHFGQWWTGPEGSIAIDTAGRAYVPDEPNHRIQIFNADGSYHGTFGSYGAGNNQFVGPSGVAINPTNGDIFVVDRSNHRIQVYTRHWVYRMTLGVLEQQGSDNRRFSWPRGVAVDASGAVYVADVSNYRVQKCMLAANDYTCTTFAGETGVFGNDNGHLDPRDVAVDAAGRVYVADQWNDRVQVYDASGAYLATIAGVWGSSNGGVRGVFDVAVDGTGNVYVADYENHRVQKFSPVVPGWKQVNVTGFGERWSFLGGLTAFGGRLYAAGAHNNAPWIWRQNADGNWSAVVSNGLGGENYWIDHLIEFNGQLYASTGHYACDDPACNTGHTDGGQIWRSADGVNWSLVADDGFGDADNLEIFRMTVFGGQLYASTLNTATGGEIWRSSTGNAGSWTRVVTGGLGDAGNQGAMTFQEHNGVLYAGTFQEAAGGAVWRSSNGTVWTPVNAGGFGSIENAGVASLASFGGFLYAGTTNWTAGAQLWRCSVCSGSDWSQMMTGGFGDSWNRRIMALPVLRGRLYALTSNRSGEGTQVWRSTNGQQWQQDAPAGFGNGNNTGPYWGNSVAVVGDRLFIGSSTEGVGNQIWQKTVTADFSAAPLTGRPPLAVSFSNTSAGDVTNTQWDFGDGQSSTQANPTHTYAQGGAYTVRLTVSDGVDSHTLTRPGYVGVWYRAYLPFSVKGYDPTIYDSFDNSAYDGSFDPQLWSGEQAATQYRQQNGALLINEPASANPTGGTLRAVRPQFRRWQDVSQVEARLKVSSDRSGAWAPIGITLHTEDVNGHSWFTLCLLVGIGGSPQAAFQCYVYIGQGGGYPTEYGTPRISVPYDMWHKVRIEADPSTGALRFYLNNALIGSRTPTDAGALVTSTTMKVAVVTWSVAANSAATRYVDDVRIVAAR
jgi:PKD repeat protein